MKYFSGLLCGVLFGLGLAISQMANPSKVIGFLDVAGNWDPSLLFVLGGAVAGSCPAEWCMKRDHRRVGA